MGYVFAPELWTNVGGQTDAVGLQAALPIWKTLASPSAASSPVTGSTPEPRGPSMMSKDIIVAVAITFAVTFAILAAKMAQSDNDRASNPTISTLPLQY